MINDEEIYKAFGLKKTDLDTIESPSKAEIENQLKIFEEQWIRHLHFMVKE
jgi:hypothetical protein